MAWEWGVAMVQNRVIWYLNAPFVQRIAEDDAHMSGRIFQIKPAEYTGDNSLYNHYMKMYDLKAAQIYELPFNAAIEPYRLRLDKTYLDLRQKILALLVFTHHYQWTEYRCKQINFVNGKFGWCSFYFGKEIESNIKK